MPTKRNLTEARETDVDKDEDNIEPSSKKRKVVSLMDNKEEPPQDGVELELDEWDFDNGIFNEDNQDDKDKDKDKEEQKEDEGEANAAGFAGFRGFGFARSISNTDISTSPDKQQTSSISTGSHTGSQEKYVSSSDDDGNKEPGQEGNEGNEGGQQEEEKLDDWFKPLNTNSSSDFNWDWNFGDDGKKSNSNSQGNKEGSSNWDFEFGSVDWATEEPEDTIEVIAELNGEQKEKGDENDEVLYECKVKVYAYKKGDGEDEDTSKAKWRECGVGMLKINQIVDSNDNNKIKGRLLCRREHVHTVVLNEPIVTDRENWYKLLKQTRVSFGVVRMIKNKNESDDSNGLEALDNKENSNNNGTDVDTSQESKEKVIPYFVKPLECPSGCTPADAAKTLLKWINVLQNCVKTQSKYQNNSNNNNNNR